jgi:hypothetical protein
MDGRVTSTSKVDCRIFLLKMQDNAGGNQTSRRSHWPCGLGCRFAATCLLGWRVRIPLRTWMFVSCVSCVLSR